MILLEVKRIECTDSYSRGELYANGVYVCDTIEDKDRGIDDSMSEEEIKKIKVYGKTAIPTGKYKVVTNIVSPKFSRKEFYKCTCEGRVPRLLNVKGFDGILIHCAGSAEFVLGCIGVGYNAGNGILKDIKPAFEKVWNILKDEDDITIEISK